MGTKMQHSMSSGVNWATIKPRTRKGAWFVPVSWLARLLTPNSSSYIHVIDKVTLVKQISPTQSIWTLHYRLPAVSARVFTVLQTVYLDTSGPKKTG